MRSFFARLTGLLPLILGWLMVALILGALVAANYFISAPLGKPVPVPLAKSVRPNDPAALKLAAEVDALEKTYQDAATTAAADGNAQAKLEQVVQKQRQLSALLGGQDEAQRNRLERLESELAGVKAQAANLRIAPLALDGRQLVATGHNDEALPKLTEALRLQREVNQSGATATLKNPGRENELAQAVTQIQVEPLHQELTSQLEAARAAVAAAQPAVALAAYNKARILQSRINHDYSSSTYANQDAVHAIDKDIDSLGADTLQLNSASAEQAGDAALAGGHAREAAEDYEQAREQQLEINNKYQLSRYMSTTRPDALEIKRQTAASVSAAGELVAQDQEIADLLRRRQLTPAGAKIALAAITINRLFTTFPKSQKLDDPLKIRLDYLASRIPKLEEIQHLGYDNLLPLPGKPDRTMLKTGVTQALYTLVADDNPSRHLDPALPVDSVSWLDAQTWCSRMSWLLGLTARLPTEAEYRAALGAPDRNHAWSHETSPEMTQPASKLPPNTAGFYDLLGNVAEWLVTDGKVLTAPVAGGSYLDTQATLLQVPIEQRAKDDRARFIGFRFVVEQGPTQLPSKPDAVGAPATPKVMAP